MARDTEVRKLVEFLQKTDLVNLEMPVSKLVDQAGDLEMTGGGGQVLIWSQWILITAPCGPTSAIVAMGTGPAESGGGTKSAMVEMGETPSQGGPTRPHSLPS